MEFLKYRKFAQVSACLASPEWLLLKVRGLRKHNGVLIVIPDCLLVKRKAKFASIELQLPQFEAL